MVEHCAKGRWDSDPLKAWAGPQTNPKQLSNPRRLSNPTTPQLQERDAARQSFLHPNEKIHEKGSPGMALEEPCP